MATLGGSSSHELAHLIVVETSPARSVEIVGLLEGQGYRVSQPTGAAEAIRVLSEDRPVAVVAIASASSPESQGWVETVCATATGLAVPVLLVVDHPTDLDLLVRVDDWLTTASAASELPLRLTRLLRRRGQATLPVDQGFRPGALRGGGELLSLVIHDLRTPLNVIGLSTRIIGQSLAQDDLELREDLRFLEENFQLMVSMLHQLSDYHRLNQAGTSLDPVAFDPRRLLDDLVAEFQAKCGACRVSLEINPSCPAEVSLDPLRAKQALQYALANAVRAAKEGGEVRLVTRGGDSRWVTDIAVDQPPPPTVQPVMLTADRFERICGSVAERPGMDLAIAARVTELFAGSARLEVRPGLGTSVVLDWPVRLA